MATWEIRITREAVQSRGPGLTNKRTVGRYAVYHDDEPVDRFKSVDFETPLFGATAESPGPGQNREIATKEAPSRVAPGRYALATFQGEQFYATYGYHPGEDVGKWLKPGIEVKLGVRPRNGILIHPAHDDFVSSIGCINLCTSLPTAAEAITYRTSRLRVIAMIEDMRRFLGSDFPSVNGQEIPGAFVVIEGEPPTPAD